MQEAKRRDRQADRIIDRLAMGPATNAELVDYSLRFGARIHELRERGYRISCTPVKAGLFKYELA